MIDSAQGVRWTTGNPQLLSYLDRDSQKQNVKRLRLSYGAFRGRLRTAKDTRVYCLVLNAHISEALSGQLLGALAQA